MNSEKDSAFHAALTVCVKHSPHGSRLGKPNFIFSETRLRRSLGSELSACSEPQVASR